MRRAWSLAALLLAPLALAQSAEPALGPWSQFGGDAQRSREIMVMDSPLDVIASGRFFEEGETVLTPFPASVPFALPTDDGLFALARAGTTSSDQTCSLIRVTEFEPLRVERRGPDPCPRAMSILGGHRAAGLMLLCRPGPGATVNVQALDTATLEERWSVGLPPEEAAAAVPDLGPASPYADHNCQAAIEHDRIVVAFSNYADNHLVAVDLEGNVLWRTSVSGATFNLGTVPGLHELDQAGMPGFRVGFLTNVEGGTFALGFLGGAGAPALAWIDREGVVIAGYSYEGSPLDDAGDGSATGPGTLGAISPVGQAETALSIIGPHFVAARITSIEPSTVTLPVAPTNDAPVWWRKHFAYSSADGVTIVSTPGFTDPWSWPPPRPTLLDLVVTQRGELMALSKVTESVNDTTGAFTPEISWLDLARRVETRRLALPIIPIAVTANSGISQPSAQLIGLDDGQVLFVSTRGHFALLGAADPTLRPGLEVPQRYPAAGVATSVRISPPASTARTILGWEDGTFENATTQEVAHVYAEEGDHVVRVTSIFPDGRTATTEETIHVGGTPPVELTAIQNAFSPENQELTFFVLGLVFTAGGVLFAALLRRRRQSHLARESRRLHELQDLAARDPVGGLAALEAHRRHLEDAHVRRKLDDAHYAHLDSRTIRAMRATRLQLLGATVNELSPHFRGLLDTALDDGRISPGELRALDAALANERVAAPERDRIRALLAGWAR